MSKLFEWIFVLNLFIGIYVMLILNRFESAFINKWMFEIQISPIILIGLFGLYSVFIILYRVFTFNDCPEAAAEIRRQIKEAKQDLSSKGFKFVEQTTAN